MKKLNFAFLITAITLCSCNHDWSGNSQKLETQIDSVSYSLGTFNALQLQGQGLSNINADAVGLGIEHIFNNDSVLISQEKAQQILERYFKELKEKQETERLKIQDSLAAVAKAWIEERLVNEEIETTESGLQYEVLVRGKGETNPTPQNEVTVHYHGSLADGTVFDSSIERGEPVSFPVNGVIPGWVEALQLMHVGDKWKLTIPGDLAYGDNGIPQAGIPPNATLVFVVELLSIQ